MRDTNEWLDFLFLPPIPIIILRMATDKELIAAAQRLCVEVEKLRFAAPVTHVYNPLVYAWKGHEAYLRRFGRSEKDVVFLGMNPGPFGMVQTGVPFGEIAAVRDWMKIEAAIGRPDKEHPHRPVLGFDCTRSEISGQRLWKLFADRFGTPDNFFDRHFVVNYCPLAFLEETGRNRTPDKLSPIEKTKLTAACDLHLRKVLEVLHPKWVIGIGDFAARKAEMAGEGLPFKIGQILHPSPASPAANRDWAGQVEGQLKALGVWK
jgi:single-strand selective monofunctional uracil DNA glycosylase